MEMQILFSFHWTFYVGIALTLCSLVSGWLPSRHQNLTRVLQVLGFVGGIVLMGWSFHESKTSEDLMLRKLDESKDTLRQTIRQSVQEGLESDTETMTDVDIWTIEINNEMAKLKTVEASDRAKKRTLATPYFNILEQNLRQYAEAFNNGGPRDSLTILRNGLGFEAFNDRCRIVVKSGVSEMWTIEPDGYQDIQSSPDITLSLNIRLVSQRVAVSIDLNAHRFEVRESDYPNWADRLFAHLYGIYDLKDFDVVSREIAKMILETSIAYNHYRDLRFLTIDTSILAKIKVLQR